MGQGLLTAGFARSGSDAALHCEGVPIEAIAADVGTPVYVYSSAVIRDRYERLRATLSRLCRLLTRAGNETVQDALPAPAEVM